MSQLQFSPFGLTLTKRLDEPHGHTSPSMDRHAGRFIDHKQLIVLEQDAVQQKFLQRRARLRCLLTVVRSIRWDADLISHIQLSLRLTAFLVNPNLAAADQPVYARPGDALEVPDKKVIQTLTDMRFIDANKLDGVCDTCIAFHGLPLDKGWVIVSKS